ncbi:hypothetical protein [Shewanella khirikhana]|uniref:Tetratricopeptide repeat protein n=1 Tax=Shewanella khirikhana TaxID=1965282 RepID=A0ABM7DRI9_9GAMM|nr:hypothetical protein [Shewanella khirikhana]AZQ12316.1 hypothetical protein STH12_03256 [Shewanella khirikhana]
MKIVVLILLVLAGVFLYIRAKRLATEEQYGRSDRPEAGKSNAPAEVEPEKAVEVQEKTAEVLEAEVLDKAAVVDVAAAVDAAQDVEATQKVEAAAAEPTNEVVAEVVAAKLPEPEPEPEPEPVIDTPAAVVTGLAVPDFAAEPLARAIREFNGAGSDELKHQSLLAAINECYKQRKDTAHLGFGAGLADDYARLAIKVLGSGKPLKGVGFMQLATLLNDKGDFNGAIDICRQALDHGLSDGTVTGFEGRIARIEKARDKAAG